MRTSYLLIACFAAACAESIDEDSSTEALQAAPFFSGDVVNHAEFAVDVSFWETPLAQSQMDCYWDSGVRHVVVGTQVDWITRQQLAMAVSRGMTVDAYVFLHWNGDVAAQIAAAFATVQGFPIGRMWLDIEEEPTGSVALISSIEQAVAACASHAGVTCGIYTSPGWWQTYVANTDHFTGVPLWYALYNNKPTLANWMTEHFGGWTTPVAKQFKTAPLCAAGGTDWNVMQVAATPTVVVDRSLPADTPAPPPAPTSLFPADGAVIPIDYVKIMSGTVPRATQYQLGLERYTGTSWATYYTWTNPNAFVKAFPPATPALFRFHVRAQNAHGWGAWSEYATFDYGNYTGPRPGSSPPPPPATPGVPGALAPNGVTITGTSVTLSCSAVTSATAYQFAIESNTGAGFTAYYTYSTTAPAKTFSPQARGTDYRFRVRAMVGGAYGAWSDYATFHVQ